MRNFSFIIFFGDIYRKKFEIKGERRRGVSLSEKGGCTCLHSMNLVRLIFPSTDSQRPIAVISPGATQEPLYHNVA